MNSACSRKTSEGSFVITRICSGAVSRLSSKLIREGAPSFVVFFDPQAQLGKLLAVNAQADTNLAPGSYFPLATFMVGEELQHGQVRSIKDLQAFAL